MRQFLEDRREQVTDRTRMRAVSLTREEFRDLDPSLVRAALSAMEDSDETIIDELTVAIEQYHAAAERDGIDGMKEYGPRVADLIVDFVFDHIRDNEMSERARWETEHDGDGEVDL
jgi:hypothetical protein